MKSGDVRQILGFFCHLIALVLGEIDMRGVRVTKNIKEIRFEKVWYELESKISFQRQNLTKYSELTLVFM